MVSLKSVVLSLDVSTSVIGWTILEADADSTVFPLEMGHIDLRKIKTGFWSKVDAMERALCALVERTTKIYKFTGLYIEDPVERFRNGLSSAHTIALLSRFNALTSYVIRGLITIDPLYIDATAARKKIGVPLLSKKKSGGIDQKVQTFNYLNTTIFKGIKWAVNKNNNVQPWVFDEVDSYVIALAGCMGLGEPA